MLLLSLFNSRLEQHRQPPRHHVTATKLVAARAITLLFLTIGNGTLALEQTVAVAQPTLTVPVPSPASPLSRDLIPSDSSNFFQQGQQQLEQEIQRLLQSLRQPQPTLLQIQTHSLTIRDQANPAPAPTPTIPPSPTP